MTTIYLATKHDPDSYAWDIVGVFSAKVDAVDCAATYDGRVAECDLDDEGQKVILAGIRLGQKLWSVWMYHDGRVRGDVDLVEPPWGWPTDPLLAPTESRRDGGAHIMVMARHHHHALEQCHEIRKAKISSGEWAAGGNDG